MAAARRKPTDFRGRSVGSSAVRSRPPQPLDWPRCSHAKQLPATASFSSCAAKIPHSSSSSTRTGSPGYGGELRRDALKAGSVVPRLVATPLALAAAPPLRPAGPLASPPVPPPCSTGAARGNRVRGRTPAATAHGHRLSAASATTCCDAASPPDCGNSSATDGLLQPSIATGHGSGVYSHPLQCNLCRVWRRRMQRTTCFNAASPPGMAAASPLASPAPTQLRRRHGSSVLISLPAATQRRRWRGSLACCNAAPPPAWQQRPRASPAATQLRRRRGSSILVLRLLQPQPHVIFSPRRR